MDIDKDARIPLGIGDLLGDSMSLFFGNLLVFMTIAFLPCLVVGMVSNWLMADFIRTANTGIPVFGPGYFVALGLQFLLIFIISGLCTLAAYDVASDQPLRYGHYAGLLLRFLLPLLILGSLYWLISWIGLVFLIVPGLYLMARYAVMAPAMLVEQAGWRSLGRAAALSRSYRWPIVGAMLLLLVAVFILSFAIQLVTSLVLFGSVSVFDPDIALRMATVEGVRFFLLNLLQAIGSSLMYGFAAVFTALLYARLREIKEGIGIENLSKVFA